MAKSSGKGEGKSTPTSTATDAASVAINSGKQSSENAGLTNPNNPSNKGEDSKGENNNPSNDSPATDAAGITLGRGEYTPGATYNAQGQQTSGTSTGPSASSATWRGEVAANSPSEVFEMTKQKQRENIQKNGLLKSLLEGFPIIPNYEPNPLTNVANIAGAVAGLFSSLGKGKGEEEGVTNPTYNPSITAEATTPAAMKEGTKNAPSKAGPATIPATTPGAMKEGTKNAPSKAAPSTDSATTPSDTAEAISVLGHNDYTPGTPAETSANNNVNQQAQSSSGYINRGSTISTTGTGGSISSGLTGPERDSGSIGLGVFDPDKANYDQDNWNRGMESQSSSLVSDEQCKQFAMRAFHEDSPAFKVVKTTIVKKLD